MPTRISLYALGVLFAASGTVMAAGIARSGNVGPAGLPQPWGAPDTVNYKLPNEDGTAEDSIGLTGTGTYDLVWLNKFTTQAGGELITNVQVAYGTPAFPAPQYNGRAVTIALYNAALGMIPGSSVNTVITNQGTNILNNYDIPDTAVAGDFYVAAITPNAPAGDSFYASWDSTVPHDNNASYIGFTQPGGSMNINNLALIPAGQYGSIEGFGLPGNWLIRATGEPIPEPASLGLLALSVAALLRRRA